MCGKFFSRLNFSTSPEMNVFKVLKKPRRIKMSRKKIVPCSRSKVLKKIIECLKNKQYQHVLKWWDESKKEFTVKFVHKNNPESKNADYLALFKEMDKLSPKYGNYLKRGNNAEGCKSRFRANLTKMVTRGVLIKMETVPVERENSIRLEKYKLNVFDVFKEKNPVSKNGKIKKNKTGASPTYTAGSHFLSVDSLPVNDTNPNEVMSAQNVDALRVPCAGSQYISLPNEFRPGAALTYSAGSSHFQLVENFPVYGMSLSKAMGTQNMDTQQVPHAGSQCISSPNECHSGAPTIYLEANPKFLLVDKLTAYGTNPTAVMGTQNVDTREVSYSEPQYISSPNECQPSVEPTYSAGSSYFRLVENSPINGISLNEAMGTQNVDARQVPCAGSQYISSPNECHSGAPPINLEENPNFPSVDNLTAYGMNPTAVMGTRNVDTQEVSYSEPQYISSLNECQSSAAPIYLKGNPNFPSVDNLTAYGMNPNEAMGTRNVDARQVSCAGTQYISWPNECQERIQDVNFKSNNCSQRVPGSPLEYNGISNELSSDWEMYDTSKPLQGACNPLLPSPVSVVISSNNIFEGNDCMSPDIKDWYSFENLMSIDGVS